MTDRTPPQAPDIERAVLGAMLIDRKAVGRAIELLGDETVFYKPVHQVLFRALTDLYDRNIPIDQLTVAEHLKQQGHLDSVGGETTIAALMNETVSAANIEYHCQVLKEKARYRKLIAISAGIQAQCFEGKEGPEAILTGLECSLQKLWEVWSR